MDIYVGIDVAFAKNKYLPIVCSVWENGVLKPFQLKSIMSTRPPKGKGNAKILDENCLLEFAEETLQYLKNVELELNGSIRRIAIDAPKEARLDNCKRRKSEEALDKNGISCITTPSISQFESIKSKAKVHLENNGKETYLPHANQLWMIVGFRLFEKLSQKWECIEVYPHAISVALGSAKIHKTKSEGAKKQLQAVSLYTGWPLAINLAKPFVDLESIAFGSFHDKLDAYLASWVASLDFDRLRALGESPDDVIWVPLTDENHEKILESCLAVDEYSEEQLYNLCRCFGVHKLTHFAWEYDFPKLETVALSKLVKVFARLETIAPLFCDGSNTRVNILIAIIRKRDGECATTLEKWCMKNSTKSYIPFGNSATRRRLEE